MIPFEILTPVTDLKANTRATSNQVYYIMVIYLPFNKVINTCVCVVYIMFILCNLFPFQLCITLLCTVCIADLCTCNLFPLQLCITLLCTVCIADLCIHVACSYFRSVLSCSVWFVCQTDSIEREIIL